VLIVCRNIRDLTARLDGVLGHLTNPRGQRPTLDADGETQSPIPSRTPIPADTDQLYGQQIMADMPKEGQNGARRTSISRGNWADRLGLNRWLLGHLLQRYRAMQHHFPFVVISEVWDVQYMLSSRPVLLLAVVSSSACQHPQIQQVLIKDLKDILSCRVAINGEQSLELLQAILIHLAW